MCRDCQSVHIHRLLLDPAISNAAIIAHLKEHHDVNQRSPCDRTPLMSAAYMGRKELIVPMLELGAVLHATNERTGDTAAHYAVHSYLVGHIRQCSTLMVLFDAGLDEMKNYDGYTPLELAAKYGNHAVRGADAERKSHAV
jgi:ankyrin repeat protein